MCLGSNSCGTADTKIATMELHDVGPVKLFDTAGIDEEGELGAKKRSKAMSVLKECDVALLVINPLRGHRCVGHVAQERAFACVPCIPASPWTVSWSMSRWMAS